MSLEAYIVINHEAPYVHTYSPWTNCACTDLPTAACKWQLSTVDINSMEPGRVPRWPGYPTAWPSLCHAAEWMQFSDRLSSISYFHSLLWPILCTYVWRGKSLLDLWVTIFLPDWQPPLKSLSDLFQASCAFALILSMSSAHVILK